ncbi:sterol desaturase family protein [Hoeflea poritis]|uniref:Sterol desaturase family protein n=1 Tax=Hoeflea poritis TaxID=2993659 RepID=A0ABT4VKM9_9HYPH|nr:sterol desaturase family protein [Hoeflea poritis]MDA4845154.1 sterol desaturase family protein [Hoeflea poritis]
MKDEAREKFRAKYRANVSPYYSGWVHLFVVLLGGTGLLYFAISRLVDFHYSQLWIVVISLLAYNVCEWASHRWWGHQKTKLFKLFYQRHTGDHHTFFVDRAMEYQMVMDWRVVIFPIYLLVVFTSLVSVPGGLVLSLLFGANIGYLFAATMTSCYLAYEILHFSYHLPRGSLIERVFRLIPGWTYLRLFHTVHHNRDLMTEGNFNITLPLSDWLFGTLYFSADEEIAPKQRRAKPQPN